MENKKMKTMKTLMLEAIITYLSERNKRIYIVSYWDVLDKLGGKVDLARDSEYVILNISAAALISFKINNNMMVFECTFGGKRTTCFVPTASIGFAYNPDARDEPPFVFDRQSDYQSETKEYGGREEIAFKGNREHIPPARQMDRKKKEWGHLMPVN